MALIRCYSQNKELIHIWQGWTGCVQPDPLYTTHMKQNQNSAGVQLKMTDNDLALSERLAPSNYHINREPASFTAPELARSGCISQGRGRPDGDASGSRHFCM